MKIIDLLNKMANGEKLPSEIMYKDKVFIYNNEQKQYFDKETGYNFLYQELPFGDLNDEIEVIEEPLKNKEVSDALHMLLHCSLKDKEYETQVEQFHIVYDYIEELENR